VSRSTLNGISAQYIRLYTAIYVGLRWITRQKTNYKYRQCRN